MQSPGASTIAAKQRPPAWRWFAIDLLLLLLVWGLFAPSRGLFQDDVVIFGAMSMATSDSTVSVFKPLTSPTRRLQGIWFMLALWSPQPILFLQLLLGLSWLATGLVARSIARALAPGREVEAYLAGALTLCATSDFLTNSLVALGYQIAILALLVATACGLAWQRKARLGYLVASVASLVISVWTLDVAMSALPLLPVLLYLARPESPSAKRPGSLWLLLSAWGAALVPYLVTLWFALRDPRSYYAAAAASLTWSARLAQALDMWAANFTPWKWVLERPLWYSTSPLPQPIPWWLMLGLVMLGTAAFVLGLRKALVPSGLAGHIDLRTVGVLLTLLGMALSGNAIFAGVQLADFHYRTHLLSRVWVSLFLALAVGLLARRWRWMLALPVFFVAFGIAGGLERQGFFLAFWREHQRELLSIREAAPGLRPGTDVVLWVPAHPRYLATEAHYAQWWITLLYADPTLHGRTMRWSLTNQCRPEADRLVCPYEGHPNWPERSMPYENLLILGFDVDRGTYRVLPHLPTVPPIVPAGYRPAERLIDRPLTRSVRNLLLLHESVPASREVEIKAPAGPGAHPPAAASRAVTDRPVVDRPLPASAFVVEWGRVTMPSVVPQGAKISVAVTAKNLGEETWPDIAHASPPGHAVRLSHRWRSKEEPPMTRAGAGYERRTDLPRPLGPGESATLTVEISAPKRAGNYDLQFDFVEEFVGWFENRGAATLLVPVSVE